MISASQLYDFVQCPHRVTLDVHSSVAEQDEPNAFVQLLWEQGLDHERTLASSLGITANMTLVAESDRERETAAAMQRGESLIYGGRIVSGDLVGVPDLLKRRGNGYIPGDIKAGSGFEGDYDDGKLKKHYAFQVAHYVNILEELGHSDGSREAFIVDREGVEVPYILGEPQGLKNAISWWDAYQQALKEVHRLVSQGESKGALAAICKICHWYSRCKRELIASDDLTLIAELGRAKRDAMAVAIPTVTAFANSDPAEFIKGKKTVFSGIGPDSLIKFHSRAKLLATLGSQPYLKQPIHLPCAVKEVFFDIESDPMRDMVYLHGFVERQHQQPESAQFVAYFAVGIGPAAEKAAFADAWTYLCAKVQDSVVYYYSAYERTAYKKLASKYLDVCSVADVEALFALPVMIDLYTDVVRKATEWPTYNQSIKTLAQYLGFEWRDTEPSGSASIEWYHRWLESQDAAIKRRILAYNEDDCIATGVVLDGIRSFR